jgi:molybdate transport system substrate-binding protein
MQAARRLRALAGLLSVAATATVNATEIHVYSSGAPAAAARVIATDFAKKNNDHFEFTVAQPAVIQADLAAGDKADVVILPRPLVTMLTGSGVLRNDSAVNVARVGIGIVVHAGAPTPNIADVAAIRQLLRDAQSIVYPDPAETGGGSAGLAVARMIDSLGLTDIVRPKLTVKAAIGGGVALVADGKVEIGLFNISEIMPEKGVTLVGPLPADLQNYILFTAAIAVKSAVPEPASAYIKQLTDPAARLAWQNAGLEPAAPSR